MIVQRKFAFGLALVALSSAPLFWDVQAQTGVPLVTSINGTVSHGSTLTISGALFGSKPQAAPFQWDDANGANNDRLESRGWLVNNRQVMPYLSNGRLRGTPGETTTIRAGMSGDNVNIFCFGNDPNGYLGLTSASAANEKPFPAQVWIDFWVNVQPPSGGSINYKFFRHHSQAGSHNGYWSFPGGSSSSWSNHGGSAGSGPQIIDQDLPASMFHNQWSHMQILFAPSTSNNGQFYMWRNGVLSMHSTNWSGNAGGAQVNFCFETQMLESNASGVMWWDDLYIDSTLARVEIGDSPLYATSRHREIQIPTAWSSSSVSVRLNRGSFPSFTGTYLYVINAQGVASPGFRLDGSGPPTIATPQNLRVVP
jgi:hypothetical protein